SKVEISTPGLPVSHSPTRLLLIFELYSSSATLQLFGGSGRLPLLNAVSNTRFSVLPLAPGTDESASGSPSQVTTVTLPSLKFGTRNPDWLVVTAASRKYSSPS